MNSTTSSGIRSALHGQRVLVVGGDRREQSLTRLRLGLALTDAVHCRTRKSDASARCFASQIQHPGIVLVVWVLGLSRTHHGEHLHRLCRDLRIPFVDCFRIPHPNALLARLACSAWSSAGFSRQGWAVLASRVIHSARLPLLAGRVAMRKDRNNA